MAKRFTDTDKWKDEWWGSLSNDYRMIWLYLIDSCSIAGIWKKDFRGLNFNCNTSITEKDFLEVFGSRLIDRGNFYFIPKFLRFQCPKGLNSNKPAIISIVRELEQNNLLLIIGESFGNDYLIIKGKDKGKGKDKDKDKGTEKEEGVQGEFPKLQPKPAKDPGPDFTDYEAWTQSVIDKNDPLFEQMLVGEGLKPNGQLVTLARDHLQLLARYPKMRPQSQQTFRYSLLKSITENLNKSTHETKPNQRLAIDFSPGKDFGKF